MKWISFVNCPRQREALLVPLLPFCHQVHFYLRDCCKRCLIVVFAERLPVVLVISISSHYE